MGTLVTSSCQLDCYKKITIIWDDYMVNRSHNLSINDLLKQKGLYTFSGHNDWKVHNQAKVLSKIYVSDFQTGILTMKTWR